MNRDARIAVVGSFAVGLTMKVERFPESGETLLGAGYRMDHGGKGSNQAVACARLGAQVSFVARIGTDALADMALKLYRDEGVDSAWLRQEADLPTGVGFILVKSGTGENCIALDAGANNLLTAEAVSASEGALSSAQVVLTQLEIPIEAAEAAMKLGRAHRAVTILNPAPARAVPPTLLQQVDVLTPNQSEARTLLGLEPGTKADPAEMARALLRRGPRQVIVTLGEEGAFIATADFEKHIPAISVTSVDSTGAGDAFNAGLAVSLARGEDLESAVRFAVVAGGLAVTREGVIPALPRLAEVLEWCERLGLNIPAWVENKRKDQ
ncbi:MAG TPA: ribokinase [Terriglobia bacterium]|nr:ribokinase [Terriglobia bacterium]